MIDVLFVEEQVILATTAQMPSFMAVMNLATLHRTTLPRFLPQEHHATKTDLIQGINIPTLKGTDHTPPIMVPDIGDILSGHSSATIPTTREAAVSEGTPHTPHLATAAAHAALQLIDAPIATHTTPQTRASLTPATPTTLHRKYSQQKPSYIQYLQPPINPNVSTLSLSRIPLQITHQIHTVTLIL